MKKDFIVNVNRFTKGMTVQGFGTPLIYTQSQDIPYTLLTDTKELDDLNVADTSEVYKLALTMFGQNPAPAEIAIFGNTEGTITQDLNEIADQHNEWFYIVSDDNTDETVKTIAAWAEANDKLYFFTTSNIEILEELEYDNTNAYLHDQEGVYLGEAMCAYFCTQDAGSATGKFKTLSGIPAANYNNTQINQIHKNGGNTYVRKYGNLETTEGLATSGEFTDIILAGYFIKFRIEERVHNTARQNKKIAYDNRGIGLMVSDIRAVTFEAYNNGLVADKDGKPDYEINYKRREEVNPIDRANRVYNDLEATINLAGAIHKGTITVNLRV